MTAIQTIALLIGFGALVKSVLRAREPRTFPIATLIKEWFRNLPSLEHLLIAFGAGIASAVIVPVAGLSSGWGQISLTKPVTTQWITLAIAGMAIKIIFVVSEEFIFRGALVSQLEHWTNIGVAVGVSALVFSVAHSGRSAIDTAILFADGVGFALAFVLTESLWVPVIWHTSKNLAVWFFLGSGTIDLAPGLLEFQQSRSGQVIGFPDSAGVLDLGVTVLVVSLVTWYLMHHRVKEDMNAA